MKTNWFKSILVSALVMLTMFGCDFNRTQNKDIEGMTIKSVVVGVEVSHVFGSCPGAKFDSTRMHNLLKDKVDSIILLQNGEATKQNFRDALGKTTDADLTIIFYSGHGGSQHFSDTGPEEVDGKDEFLCLYDGAFRDNEIWKYIESAKGRVFLIFDCCHSETMFRSAGFTMSMVNDMVFPEGEDGVQMLCWSGCADSTFSYGSSSGGELTNTLLSHYKKGISYEDLWNAISNDKRLKNFEIVKRTQIGHGFLGEAFK